MLSRHAEPSPSMNTQDTLTITELPHGKRDLKKVSLDALVDEAIHDDDACAAAALFEDDIFPSRGTLTRYGLTETNFLALQRNESLRRNLPRGIIYSIPGGAASILAEKILKSDLSARSAMQERRRSQTPINVLLMIHGAIAPNPPIHWEFEA